MYLKFCVTRYLISISIYYLSIFLINSVLFQDSIKAVYFVTPFLYRFLVDHFTFQRLNATPTPQQKIDFFLEFFEQVVGWKEIFLQSKISQFWKKKVLQLWHRDPAIFCVARPSILRIILGFDSLKYRGVVRFVRHNFVIKTYRTIILKIISDVYLFSMLYVAYYSPRQATILCSGST